MKGTLIAAATLAAITGPLPASAAVIANQPYLCFDRTAAAGCGTADSPFAAAAGSYDYFHLETLEDGLLNTPGVSLPASLRVVRPGSSTDSVDADDGLVNGLGNGGHSLFGFGEHVFTFNAAVLGRLPTDVGIVWTDGDRSQVGADFTFSFFDANGALLGAVSQRLGDTSNFGTTAEDRFFGWTGTVGVGSFKIAGNSIELDHLQYGAAGLDAAVPEPATWAMLITGFGLVGATIRRRRRPGVALA